MNKMLLRMVPLVVLLWTATLAWSQAPLAKGSFTLPMQARWGQVALAPGEYTFVIPDKLAVPQLLELRHDGKFVAYILATAQGDGNFNGSSVLLQRSGNTFAVKELRIGRVADFSYKLPTARASEQVAQAPEINSVPIVTAAK